MSTFGAVGTMLRQTVAGRGTRFGERGWARAAALAGAARLAAREPRRLWGGHLALLVVAGLALAPVVAAQGPPDDAQADAALAKARDAAQGLASELRALLQDELGSGGPERAIEVCAEAAQALTQAHRERSGVDVRRVSLRPRNATNTPDPHEREVLERFEALPAERRAAAEDVTLVTETGGRRSMRYMKPLLTGRLCLACHGAPSAIDPAVQAAIAQRYPADRAVGFAEGDVRGAISVRVRLDNPR